MPEKPVSHPQALQEMIDEQMLQESEKRKHINRVLISILVFLLPIVTGIIAITLTGSTVAAILEHTEIFTVVALFIFATELGVSLLVRIGNPRKKAQLKWVLVDTYLRHLNESAFNPEKDIQKNDESPT